MTWTKKWELSGIKEGKREEWKEKEGKKTEKAGENKKNCMRKIISVTQNVMVSKTKWNNRSQNHIFSYILFVGVHSVLLVTCLTLKLFFVW